MSGFVILRGQGPQATLRVGPDPTPFAVPIVGGGFAVCSFSAVTPSQILPVPTALSLPAIVSGAQAGVTPTITAVAWSGVPLLPEGMTRTVETRFTIAGSPVSAPLGAGTVGQSVRVEQRARHEAGAIIGAWSAWIASDAVVVTQREGVFSEPLVYTLTLPPFIASRLGIAPTADGNLIATGVGAVTISITSPTEYVGGPFSADQSEEGAAGAITFEAPLTAPQALLDPVISRTAIAPGGTGFKVGDTFTARRAIWIEDADDTATAQQTGQWRYGTTPIAGATGLTIVAPAPGGNLNYLDTLTGAGTTRTAVSGSITVAASARGADFPALTYTLTLPDFEGILGVWDVIGTATGATINTAPAKPATPAVTGTATGATITG